MKRIVLCFFSLFFLSSYGHEVDKHGRAIERCTGCSKVIPEDEGCMVLRKKNVRHLFHLRCAKQRFFQAIGSKRRRVDYGAKL